MTGTLIALLIFAALSALAIWSARRNSRTDNEDNNDEDHKSW